MNANLYYFRIYLFRKNTLHKSLCLYQTDFMNCNYLDLILVKHFRFMYNCTTSGLSNISSSLHEDTNPNIVLLKYFPVSVPVCQWETLSMLSDT